MTRLETFYLAGRRVMGFAGSRRLDERRRRRLASEPVPKRRKKTYRVDQAHSEDAAGSAIELGSPILSCLPSSSWKLSAITLLSAAAAAVVLFVALAFEQDPRWGEVVGIRSGKLLPFMTVGLAFGTAQLATVVYWYRKRSRRDFAGRYQRWLTAAITGLATATCLGTGVHRVLGQLASENLPPAAWNTPTVCWTVPAGVLFLFLAPALLRELRAFGTAAILFIVGSLAIATAIGLELVGNVALDRADMRFVTAVAAFVAAWSLFHAFWWHARHIVRVCNEPPPVGQLRGELRRLIPRRSSKAKLETVEGETSEEDESPTEQVDAPAAQATRPQRRSVFALISGVVTSPLQAPRRRYAAWKASRVEAAELRRAEKEEQKAKKAAAAAEREAARVSAREAKIEAKRLAAEEKAEAKRLAAVEKAKQQDAKIAERAAAKARRAEETASGKQTHSSKTAESPAEAEMNEPQLSAAERRAERKAKRRQRTAAELESVDRSHDFDDGDDESPRGQKRRRKKSRRS